MDKFKDRQKAFEAEQSQKEQTEFEKRNSRNKIFAQYILDDIGQSDNSELLREIILSDLEEPGDEDIIRKALDVLAQNNGSLTREDLVKKLSEIYTTKIHYFAYWPKALLFQGYHLFEVTLLICRLVIL